jgi:hypothetical protein
MELQAELTEEEEVALNVTLTRDGELDDDTVICPFYPDPRKEEYWWIIVGVKNTNKVLATKRTILKTK